MYEDLYEEEEDMLQQLVGKVEDFKENSISLDYLRPDCEQVTEELILPVPEWASSSLNVGYNCGIVEMQFVLESLHYETNNYGAINCILNNVNSILVNATLTVTDFFNKNNYYVLFLKKKYFVLI